MLHGKDRENYEIELEAAEACLTEALQRLRRAQVIVVQRGELRAVGAFKVALKTFGSFIGDTQRDQLGSLEDLREAVNVDFVDRRVQV